MNGYPVNNPLTGNKSAEAMNLYSKILVGVILEAAVYTGTTTFSSKNSSPIKWEHVSQLYDLALVRKGLDPLNRAENSMKSSFKAVKARLKSENWYCSKYLRDFTLLNENGCLLKKEDIEAYLENTEQNKKMEVDETSYYSVIRKNSWTREQERVLYGIICNLIQQNGSLHASERNLAPWDKVRSFFIEMCEYLLPHQKGFRRNASSLQRHYKEMRGRLIGPEGDPRYLKKLHDEYYELVGDKVAESFMELDSETM